MPPLSSYLDLLHQNPSVESPSSGEDTSSDSETYRATDIVRFAAGRDLESDVELVYSRLSKSFRLVPVSVSRRLDKWRQFSTLADQNRAASREFLAATHRVDSLIAELCALVLPATLARLLDRLRRYRSKQGHAAEVRQQATVDAEFEDLLKGGLLISSGELLGKHSGSSSAVVPPSHLATVGIITRDRIDSLVRSLTSYIEHSRMFSRTNDFVVMDDSAAPDYQEASREGLKTLATTYGVDVYYAGFREKRSFATMLAAEGNIPAHVIDFSLFDVTGCGHSAGANRR